MLYGQLRMEQCTLDVEKFAGLNVRGFNPNEVFTEILLHFLGQKCLFLERCLYLWKNFHGALENCENHKSLAQ